VQDKTWIINYILKVRPWSLNALLLVVVVLGVAALLREIFASFGSTLYFATFYPSLLIVSVFAGVPAGVLMAILTILIVWWAFLPPPFHFAPLTRTDYGNFTLFLLAAALIIGLSHLYRMALRALLATESARALAIEELNHRAGNLLAVVQAVINGTVTEDKLTAQRLSNRISALARANAMVTIAGKISLETIIRSEVSPYVSDARLILDGPEVPLSGRTARNIAMVLHELTTNAAKYGALSNQQGTLHISWSEKDEKCSLFWKEVDGPAVRTPERSGFGSRMMRASLATINGTIDPEFRPHGYSCLLCFSIAVPE
jgi:two-component sensor histidine kinase